MRLRNLLLAITIALLSVGGTATIAGLTLTPAGAGTSHVFYERLPTEHFGSFAPTISASNLPATGQSVITLKMTVAAETNNGIEKVTCSLIHPYTRAIAKVIDTETWTDAGTPLAGNSYPTENFTLVGAFTVTSQSIAIGVECQTVDQTQTTDALMTNIAYTDTIVP